MTRIITPILVAAALAAAAIPAFAAADSGGPQASAARATTVKAVGSRYGKVLFDGRGRALYLFTADKGRTSTCYGACAKAWPVLVTKGAPRAGAGVRASLLGTTRRKDGSRQVTYAGHPLYRYEGESAGQIKCQNVSNFGGLWLVVRPNGSAVRGS